MVKDIKGNTIAQTFILQNVWSPTFCEIIWVASCPLHFPILHYCEPCSTHCTVLQYKECACLHEAIAAHLQ